MKRNIIIILFLAFGLPCLAQDMAQCRVTYLGSGWLSNRDMKKREVLWNLDLGGHSSYFYNPDHKALSLEAKQLDSYGTMSDAYALLDKYPAARRYPMEVFCNYPEQGAYTYEYQMLKPLVYTDKMPKTEWHLTDSTKQVCGFLCRQAMGSVAGRDWTVWFTPEIPFSFGPWILGGLSGLILEAEDTEHYFHFIAQGVEQLGTPAPMELLFEDTAISCTRERFMELRLLAGMDPAQYAYEVTGFDGGGNIDYKERNRGLERYFLERE